MVTGMYNQGTVAVYDEVTHTDAHTAMCRNCTD